MAPPAAVPRCPTPHAPTRRFVVPGIASGGRDRQISPPVDGTRDAFGPWPARLTWLLLPLVSGPALGDALNGTSRPVQVVASVGLWVGWAAVLVATLVPTTVSLTALRVVAPAAVVAPGAALVAGDTSTADTVGLAGAGPRGVGLGAAGTPPVDLLLVRRGRDAAEAAETGALLISPTRPGAVLDEARRRRMA